MKPYGSGEVGHKWELGEDDRKSRRGTVGERHWTGSRNVGEPKTWKHRARQQAKRALRNFNSEAETAD